MEGSQRGGHVVKRWFFLLVLLGGVAVSFAERYAYFYGRPILRPNEEIFFVVSELKSVTLTVWELKDEDFLKAVLEEPSPESVGYRLERPVHRGYYTPKKILEDFSIKLKRQGTYLATLTYVEKDKEILLDKALFVVTTLDVVYFSDGNELVFYVLDQERGFAEGAEVSFFRGSKLVKKAFTDESGKVVLDQPCDVFYVKYGESRFLGDVYLPYHTAFENEKLFFLTDRPIYKPSDAVHFRGQLFKVSEGFYEAFGQTKVAVTIFDTKNNEIQRFSFETDELGGFHGSFRLPETAQLGMYRVRVDHDGREYFETFLVEEYRKPEYKIEVRTSKDTYLSGEVVDYEIKVSYFNEQPVVRAQVAYYVHALPEYEESYLVYRGMGLTDENGVLRFGVKIPEGFDGLYRIEVTATDESQRQIEEVKEVKILADDVLIKLDQEFLTAAPRQPVSIDVKVTDLSGRPLDGVLKVEYEKVVEEVKVTNGKARFVFVPKEAKSYRLELSFRKAKKYLYVYAYQGAKASGEFVILPATRTVKPGERLRVQVLAPGRTMGVLALVSGKIYQTLPVSFVGFLELDVQVPQGVFEKNLFLTFIGYQEDKPISRFEKLDVALSTNVTKMKLSFDRDRYEPGEMALLTIEADVDKVCLMLVDEAIYALTRSEPMDLESFLYPSLEFPGVMFEFADTWRLYTSRPSLQLQLASLPSEKSLADFKRTALASKVNVREYFPDTALWIPSIELSNGIAKVSFKVPDSITTFRATAYGFSRRRFAQSEGKVVVSKDFYVRPHLPTFLREGDLVQLSATLFNRTGKEQRVVMWQELSDNLLLSRGTETREFLIGPNSSRIETWLVKAIQPFEGSLVKILAIGEEGDDAVSLTLPVKPFAFERQFYLLESIDGEKSVTLPSGSFVFARLRVFKDLVPLVKDSVEKLIKYPYGCVEQTMSSFFPAVVAANLGLKVENLDEIVWKGLFKLYDYQHYDGGWGWWKFDESNNFMTCYVMEGLYFAGKAGYDVAESVIRRGIEYLIEHPSAYGSYVLNLYGVEHEGYEPEDETDLVFLSMVSREHLEKILKIVTQEDHLAFLKVKPKDPLISEVQLNGVLLRALAKWKVDPNLQTKLVNYLLSKKDGHFWYSTKDTSFAVLALLEALPKFETPSLLVSNGGKTFAIGEGEVELLPGSLSMKGRGLVEVHVVYMERPERAVSEGIKVNRSFYKRYELFLEESKRLIDVFVPIGRGYIPTAIRLLERGFDEEIFALPFEEYEERGLEYRGVSVRVSKTRVKVGKDVHEFTKLKTLDGTILVVTRENEAFVYDTKTGATTRYSNVLDADLTKNGVVLLKKEGLIVGNTVIPVPDDVQALTCTGSQVLLRGKDKTYWYRDGEYEELPFVANKVFHWNGRVLIVEGVRFGGNRRELVDGVFEILFEPGDVVIEAGDLVKTVITLSEGEGNYLVVEDFFPSCAQVILNYREKSMKEYKFDYGWYTPWEEWYVARELHADRIAFFTVLVEEGKFDYVWRATADGEYWLLPARVYPMYTRGVYAHSDPDVLRIGLENGPDR